MFRKCFAIAAFILLAALTLTGCAKTTRIDEISGKIFVYEYEHDNVNGSFPDKFKIALNKNGTFDYIEAIYSSHIGIGSWELDGDTLVLREETTDFQDPHKTKDTLRVFRFKVGDDGLVFLSDGSDSFPIAKVSGGESFLPSEESFFG